MQRQESPTTAASTPALLRATDTRERIAALDVLRGGALLGILVMNIDTFGSPEGFHDIPLDVLSWPYSSVNMALFLIKWIFFEGKMRGLFSMLFGAGVILMTDRAQRRGAGEDIADIYLRRNMLLVLFGLIHGCLIWGSDILFDYGLAALLFLYPCRKLKPKTLLITGTVLSLVVATYGAMLFNGTVDDLSLSRQAREIAAREQAGQPLTEEQKQARQAWQDRIASQRIQPADQQIAAANRGYFAGVAERLPYFLGPMFYRVHIDLIADNVSAMLIGMGLLRIGFLTGELPYGTYIWTALIGFAVSVPVYLVGLLRALASKLNFLTVETWVFGPYYLTREAGMLAITAAIVMLIKSGRLAALQRLVASVGRMALTNYLLTSLICQFVFVWGPWKLFGRLEYYQLCYVVIGVWAVNLIFSSLWLRAFEFGPMEWVWRCLTYLKAQPIRLRQQASRAAR
jgi:uncharacterized protein